MHQQPDGRALRKPRHEYTLVSPPKAAAHAESDPERGQQSNEDDADDETSHREHAPDSFVRLRL